MTMFKNKRLSKYSVTFREAFELHSKVSIKGNYFLEVLAKKQLEILKGYDKYWEIDD